MNTRLIVSLTSSVALLLLLSPSIAQEPNGSEGLEKDFREYDVRPALPINSDIGFESQCGFSNEQQDVELYDGTLGVPRAYVDTYEPSTAQLQWLTADEMVALLPDDFDTGNVSGQRWCTGTLVDDDIILTAGHCFDTQSGQNSWITPSRLDSDSVESFASPKTLARLMKVNFGYQRNGNTFSVREGFSFPIVELVEYRVGNLDYAVVQIGMNEAGELPKDLKRSVLNAQGDEDLVERFPKAKISARGVVANETLAIIQHPQGRVKQVDAGSAFAPVGPHLFYGNIDTHGGSSGSGVRDGSGTVVAIHTNGGCTDTGGANRAVTLEAVSQLSDTVSRLVNPVE